MHCASPTRLLIIVCLCRFNYGQQLTSASISSPFKRGRSTTSSELYMSSTEIIVSRGYPVEVHQVITDDGYILELHRIPAKSANRRAVFIQHGVFQSDANWIVNPTESSLAFQLWDLGFDVWLGNSRGNTYSRKHVTLDADKDLNYWNFSWDEMGNYDIPAVIEYILKINGQQRLIYIGHSLGCGMFFIAMINHPELNDRIELMIALAPATSMAYFKNYLRLLSPFVDQIAFFLRLLRVRNFVDQSTFARRMQNLLCNKLYFQAHFCRLGLMILTGPNPKNLDLKTFPLVQSHASGSGTSVNTILQFMQNHNSGQGFKAFDYGKEENLKRYGTKTPQSYDLKQVKVPVHIFWGENDYVVAPKDVQWLASNLGNLSSMTRVSDPKFNHIDFLFGKNVNEMVYHPLIKLLPPAAVI